MPAPSQTKLRPAVVDNPFFSRAHRADASNPRTIPAIVNVRESAIATLAARGQLDAAQVAAADRFRRLWETIGGAGAIDPARLVVDGGKAREPINERQVAAGKALAKCRALLGVRGYRLVSLVCGQGHALTEIAPGKRERLTAADMLRMSLDDLAGLWGMATR
ncbi:hypothetical protein [Mesorhizobium sp. M1378]|uniref:hypothetical protein n=1 Tax=Mesorhizobium sp. M1378 TaxID=2957092 RepID=UPI003338201E